MSDSRPAYLALGDSVVFGFRLNAKSYADTPSFVGYPTYVGKALGLLTTNASCPGEGTGGFISTTSPIDNGCHFFRTEFALHVRYPGSQLDFALSFLQSHPGTRLVTVGLGANDGFLLARRCGEGPACLRAGLPGLQKQIETNLHHIVTAIKATGYSGRLLLTDYYSLDYTDARTTLSTQQINRAIGLVSHADGVAVVDAYAAFRAAADARAHGQTCLAGLLNRISPGPTGCDVHPSAAGQELLAKAVEAAYLRS